MKLLKEIENIVREAGNIVLSAKDIINKTTQKTSAADLVTEYDVKVENFLKEKLPPLVEGSIFFGEEEKENKDASKGWSFIVDPIDGTANFIKGFSQSAISVALAKDSEVMYAVVFDVYKNEMFTAEKGKGSYFNGEKISVSDLPLSKGIFALGSTPYNKELHKKTMEITNKLFDMSCDFRRMGAAALDLCAVACGRLEAYFELELSPWDYAAGSLIVTEAGGSITRINGEKIDPTKKGSVWVSNMVNKDLYKKL